VYAFDIADADHQHFIEPNYRPSASVRFASQHDDTYIYLMLVVTDDAVVSRGDPLYDDDSVSLFIDAAGDRAGPYGADDHEIVIGAAGTYVDYAAGSHAAVVGTVERTATGWLAEIGIQRDTLSARPLPRALGFS